MPMSPGSMVLALGLSGASALGTLHLPLLPFCEHDQPSPSMLTVRYCSETIRPGQRVESWTRNPRPSDPRLTFFFLKVAPPAASLPAFLLVESAILISDVVPGELARIFRLNDHTWMENSITRTRCGLGQVVHGLTLNRSTLGWDLGGGVASPLNGGRGGGLKLQSH